MSMNIVWLSWLKRYASGTTTCPSSGKSLRNARSVELSSLNEQTTPAPGVTLERKHVNKENTMLTQNAKNELNRHFIRALRNDTPRSWGVYIGVRIGVESCLHSKEERDYYRVWLDEMETNTSSLINGGKAWAA